MDQGPKYGGDFCKAPGCSAIMSSCGQQKVACTKVASSAFSSDEYVQLCNTCEGNQQSAHICDVGAYEWCKGRCFDESCKKRLGGEWDAMCGSGTAMLMNIPTESERVCPPGQKLNAMGICQPATAAASTDANSKQQCQAAVQSASRSCEPPPGIVLGTDSRSIAAMCSHLKNQSLGSAQDAVRFGNQCKAAIDGCVAKCGDAADKNRGDSEIGTLGAACRALNSRVAQASRSGLNAMSDSEKAERCGLAAKDDPSQRISPQSAPSTSPGPGTQQPASSNPSTSNPNQRANNDKGSGGGGSGSGSPSFPGAQNSPYENSSANYENGAGFTNCTMDPSAPGCQAQLPQEHKADSGQIGGFRESEDAVQDKSFNVADSGGIIPSGYNGNGEGGAPNLPGGQGRGGGGVPNNTGGGIPGSDGGQGARIQPQGRGHVPTAGASTDIMQGFQGGGGYSPSASGSGLESDRDGRGRQRGGGAQGRAPTSQAIDLRQYLPGGRMDPGRRAGGFRPNAMMDIHASHVNIWLKVGDRLREKCRLGVLIDCR